MSYICLVKNLYHSHKTRKDSLETRAVHIKIYALCWNLANCPRQKGWFFQNLACTKGDQPGGSNFHNILDKIEADRLQITRK